MTRHRAAQIKAHWPLLVIVASIFLGGWRIKADITAEVQTAVAQAEKRITEQRDRELTPMRSDVREIRTLLTQILERGITVRKDH